MTRIETLLTPADTGALTERDLSNTTCVVFDVLRATSTMVTALAQGATRILPAQEIEDALLLKRVRPDALLAGERGGHRITASVSGAVDFDLGNSPREFTPDRVRGRTILMTTTNGTRALRMVSGAPTVLAGSFLNLSATADALLPTRSAVVLLVCAGTGQGAAYEDTLAAGATCEWILRHGVCELDDASQLALDLWLGAKERLGEAMARGANGRRLLADPALRDDVAFCARVDALPVVVGVADGIATLVPIIRP